MRKNFGATDPPTNRVCTFVPCGGSWQRHVPSLSNFKMGNKGGRKRSRSGGTTNKYTPNNNDMCINNIKTNNINNKINSNTNNSINSNSNSIINIMLTKINIYATINTSTSTSTKGIYNNPIYTAKV